MPSRSENPSIDDASTKMLDADEDTGNQEDPEDAEDEKPKKEDASTKMLIGSDLVNPGIQPWKEAAEYDEEDDEPLILDENAASKEVAEESDDEPLLLENVNDQEDGLRNRQCRTGRGIAALHIKPNHFSKHIF